MTDYERLKKRLAATPCLVADAEVKAKASPPRIELMSRQDAERIKEREGPFPMHAIIDLAAALEGFAKLYGVGKKDREFSLPQIAKIAGISYHLAYKYMVDEIFEASIQRFQGSGKGESVEARFSWADAFIAGAIGCLRRNGIPAKALKEARLLLSETEINETEKQTARKVTTSKRS